MYTYAIHNRLLKWKVSHALNVSHVYFPASLASDSTGALNYDPLPFGSFGSPGNNSSLLPTMSAPQTGLGSMNSPSEPSESFNDVLTFLSQCLNNSKSIPDRVSSIVFVLIVSVSTFLVLDVTVSISFMAITPMKMFICICIHWDSCPCFFSGFLLYPKLWLSTWLEQT